MLAELFDLWSSRVRTEAPSSIPPRENTKLLPNKVSIDVLYLTSWHDLMRERPQRGTHGFIQNRGPDLVYRTRGCLRIPPKKVIGSNPDLLCQTIG
jgi:hypothetical protein